MKCINCKNHVSIPTAHFFNDDNALCGRCAIEFYKWYKGRMSMMSVCLKNKKTGERMKECFAEAIARSIV